MALDLSNLEKALPQLVHQDSSLRSTTRVVLKNDAGSGSVPGDILLIEHAVIGTETMLLNCLLNDPQLYALFPPKSQHDWSLRLRETGVLEQRAKQKMKGRTFPVGGRGSARILSPTLTTLQFNPHEQESSNASCHVFTIDEGFSTPETFCVVYATRDIAAGEEIVWSFERSAKSMPKDAAQIVEEYASTDVYAALCLSHVLLSEGCYTIDPTGPNPRTMVTNRYMAFLAKYYDTTDPRVGLLQHHADIRRHLDS